MSVSQCGCVEVISGCVCAGKTNGLIMRLARAIKIGQSVVAFKWARDSKNPSGFIESRTGRRFPAIEVGGHQELHDRALEAMAGGVTVIGIDEGHFFGSGLESVAQTLARLGARVIVTVLSLDVWGRPLAPAPNLMAFADRVTKLEARCARCGAQATRTQILRPPPSAESLTDQDFVGGDNVYEPRCRSCYDPPRLGG